MNIRLLKPSQGFAAAHALQQQLLPSRSLGYPNKSGFDWHQHGGGFQARRSKLALWGRQWATPYSSKGLNGQIHPKRLVLVDGHTVLFRFHHAYGGALKTTSGENTSIVYGFIKQLIRLLALDPAPTHMVVVFDAAGKNFRHELFPGYKEQRPPMPKEIKEAIPIVLHLLELMRIPVLRVHGVEADDIIGTLAAKAADEGSQATIVSSDKDFYQLLQSGVQLLRAISRNNSGSGNYQYVAGLRAYTATLFEEEFGIKPEQWPDVRALSGDKSDNIPGIPGIGDKGALQLIKEYGDIENLLQNAHKIKRNKYREELSSDDGQARALLGLRLVQIQRQLDIPPLRAPLENFGLRSLTKQEQQNLLDKFTELEFANLSVALESVWKGNSLKA